MEEVITCSLLWLVGLTLSMSFNSKDVLRGGIVLFLASLKTFRPTWTETVLDERILPALSILLLLIIPLILKLLILFMETREENK